MNDPGSTRGDDDDDSKDSRAFVRLLKRALGPQGLSKDAPDILVGVQRKLRKRSRGKFFSDGWSTTNAGIGHVVVAAVMLVILGVAYVVLGPLGVVRR
jgi:hypothetical protein